MQDLQRMLDDIKMEVHLTRKLIRKNALDERVMAAMAKVPRHEFIPETYQCFAYDNNTVAIGSGRNHFAALYCRFNE